MSSEMNDDEEISQKNILTLENFEDTETIDKVSMVKTVLTYLFRDKKALTGLVILGFITFCAIFAPLIAPYHPNEQILKSAVAPSAQHWLGTDYAGRDLLSRMIFGARISLLIGILPTTVSMSIGIFLGMIAGFAGKKLDYLIMRFADVCLAFPSLILAMVVMYTFGASLINIFIALSLIKWADSARVVRSLTLSLKEKEFVEAARSFGVSKYRIMFRHIFPNCLPSLLVLFTFEIPAAILTEASLSFLGVGAKPPTPSWGLMILQGKESMLMAPWAAIAPGVAILIVVLAFNFIGDGLRDALDPFTKG